MGSYFHIDQEVERKENLTDQSLATDTVDYMYQYLSLACRAQSGHSGNLLKVV